MAGFLLALVYADLARMGWGDGAGGSKTGLVQNRACLEKSD